MEGDSGYFSQRSADFTFASVTPGGSHARFPGFSSSSSSASSSSSSLSSADDLFSLSFHDLPSSKYHYVRYGFTDEDDFEEFKRELRDFQRLKRKARGGGGGGSEGGGSGGGGGQLSEDNVDRAEERRVGTLAQSVKVTDTAREDGGDEGGGRAESPGDEVRAGDGDIPRESRRWSGESDLRRSSSSSSQVNTGISFREGSGGARAKEAASRRNGVYFEEGCVVDHPGPRTDWDGGGHEQQQQQQQQCQDGGPERGEGERGRSGSVNIPGDVSFSAGEKRGSVGDSGGGLRRVSFRDTPERFVVDVETPVRFSAETGKLKNCGEQHNTGSASRSSVLKQESKSYAEGLSDFDRESFRPGSYASCSKLNAARKARSVDDPTFSGAFSRGEPGDLFGLSSARQTWPSLSASVNCRERSQPIEIPIKLVNVPVSRPDNTSRAYDGGSFCSDRSVVVEKERTPLRCDSALPPRDPSSVRSGVKRRVGEDPLNVHGNVTGRQGEPEDGDSQRVSRDRVGEEDRHRANPPRPGTTCPPKRSSLLESLRRLSGHGRPRSGRGADSWMDLFGGDDSFQEFERVFETINSHRLSRDLDMRRPGNWWRDDGSEKDPGEVDDLGILHIDEDFLDFFDHDEDFMEFERELENIKSNRRSKLLENLHRRSSCDIFEDVKAFCDRNLNRNITPSSSPKVQRRLSATNSADTALWNSAEEWGLVLNKLRRNSRLLSDQALNSGAGRGDGGRSEMDYLSRNRTLPAALTDRERAGRFHLGAGGEDCQYTCHLSCVPSVTLDCTTVSPGSGGGPVATPSDLPSPSGLPSPSPSASAETSLIERRTVVAHRSPQKQSCAAASPRNSEPVVQTVSPSVQHLAPPSSTNSSGSSFSSSVSSIRDPLSGAYVSSSTSLSSSASSTLGPSSMCVEKDLNQNAKNIDGGLLPELRAGEDVCDASNEKDETDSGYRSGTIPEEKLPKAPSQATLNRMELRRKIQSLNHFVPSMGLEQKEDGESFQGFLRVTLNLIRPITMELGARPPSIYELLTQEHIVEQSTQHVAFYMPRDTVKSIHISSNTTTKEVVKNLLKKFHILDHPRKFAMYEQEFNEKNKLVKLRRLTDKDCPLVALLSWEPERVKHYRLVLQENETGEIVWENFSEPELKNFQIVLDREENEAIAQLQYKYRVMKRIILQRMKELRQEKQASKESRAR